MTLHLLALPHTRVSSDFCGCAYTSKVLKFCRMMDGLADVVLYAPEGAEAPALETVEVISDAERVGIFGADDPNRLPAWPTNAEAGLFNARAAPELMRRYEPGDLILLTAGLTQAPIRELLPDATYCEPGVGYEGIATEFCAFESYAWRHHVYAKRGINGRWFDTVIPNYFDPDEFQLAEKPDDPYLLFVGRLIANKGATVALELATAAGLPLVVAGAGATQVSEGLIVADDVRLEGDVRYVGPVGVEDRAELMAGATALLAPTYYVEPFGGVAVEAMLSGTPAITTDWGAFVETVEEGVTGFRFATLADGVAAVALAAQLEPADVRARAIERFSLEAVAPEFLSWFERLALLRGRGWYEMTAPDAIMRP